MSITEAAYTGCFNDDINKTAIAAIVCHKKLNRNRFDDLKSGDFVSIFSEIVGNNNGQPIFIGSESENYADGEENAKYKIAINDMGSLLITTDNNTTQFDEWASQKKITELSNLLLELYFTKGCRIFKMLNGGEIIMKVSNLKGTGPKLPNLKKSLITFFENNQSLDAIKRATLNQNNADLRMSINEIAKDLFQIFSNKEGNKETAYYDLFEKHNDSIFFSEIRTLSDIPISYVTDERKPTGSVNTTLYYPMVFYILYLQDLMKPDKLGFDEIKSIKNILNVIDPFDLVKMKERFDDKVATLDPRQFLVVNKFTKFKPEGDKACFLFHGVGTGKTITSLSIALSHLTANNITEIAGPTVQEIAQGDFSDDEEDEVEEASPEPTLVAKSRVSASTTEQARTTASGLLESASGFVNQTKETASTAAIGLLDTVSAAETTAFDKSESTNNPKFYEPDKHDPPLNAEREHNEDQDAVKKPLRVLIIAPQGIFLGAFRTDCAALGIYTYNTQVNTDNGIDISSYSGAIKFADNNLSEYYEVEFIGMDYINLWKDGAIDLLLSNKYDALICDEAHQLILNELSPKSVWGFKTKRFDTRENNKGDVVPDKDPSNLTMAVIEDYRFLKFLVRNVYKQTILLTGTPIQKTPRDMLKIIYLLNCPALNKSNFETYTTDINAYVKGAGSEDYYFAPHGDNAVLYLTSYFEKSIALCHNLATMAGGILNKKISKEDANTALIKGNSFAIITTILGENNAKEITQILKEIKGFFKESKVTIESINDLMRNFDINKFFKLLAKLEKIIDWIDENKDEIINGLPNIFIPKGIQKIPDANELINGFVGGLLTDENKGELNSKISDAFSIISEGLGKHVRIADEEKERYKKIASAVVGSLKSPSHFTAEEYHKILQLAIEIQDRKIKVTSRANHTRSGGKKASKKGSKKTLRTQRVSGKNKKILGGADPLTWGAFIYLGLTSAAVASLKASLFALFSYIVSVLFFDFKTTNDIVDKLVEYTLYNIQLIMRALSGKGKESGGISGIIYNFFKGIISIIYQAVSAPIYALKYGIYLIISIVGNLFSVMLLLIQPDYKLNLMVKHLLPFTSIYNYDYMNNAIDVNRFYKTIFENDYKIIEYVNSEGNSNTFPEKHIENIYVPYDDIKAFNMTIPGIEIDSLVDGRRYTDAYKLGIRDVPNLDESILNDEELTKESYELNRRFLNYFCGVGYFNMEIVPVLIKNYKTDNDAIFKQKRKEYGSRFSSGIQLGYQRDKTPSDIQYNLHSNTIHSLRTGESVIKDGESKVIPINISSNYSKPIETIIHDANQTIVKLVGKIQTNSAGVMDYLYSTPTPDDIKVTGDVLGSGKDDTSKHFENALRLLLVMKTGAIAHNATLCLHPHYICKKPDNSDTDITVEYYLPIIYPPTEEVMYGFCNYLNSKGYKYIWMCNKFDSEEMQAQVEYAQIFTYPIGRIEDNKNNKTDPICVIISPNHKEGFSFTFNPALITFGLSDTAGDEEQIYGRVLRKYGIEGFNGKYDKKLYQYFNGGSKNEALIGWISLLNKINANSTYRNVYSKVIYSNNSWVPTSIVKPLYLLRQAVDTFFRSNLLLPEGARRLDAFMKYSNKENPNMKEFPEIPERNKLEGGMLDIFLQSEVSSFYQESQLQILTSVKTTSLGFFQIYASLEKKIREPDEMVVVSDDISTVPGAVLGIQPSDLTSILRTSADEDLTYCIQNLKDISDTTITNDGILTLKNCLVCVPNLEVNVSGERQQYREEIRMQNDAPKINSLKGLLNLSQPLLNEIGKNIDSNSIPNDYDKAIEYLEKEDAKTKVGFFDSALNSRILLLFNNLQRYDKTRDYATELDVNSEEELDDRVALMALKELRNKYGLKNISFKAAKRFMEKYPKWRIYGFGGTRHYKKTKSRSTKRRTRKYKTRK